MAQPVKPPTRRYRSTLRAHQTQETRRRILDAATRLFVAQGYAATTVTAVAAEAGVVPETIYGTVGGKNALLHEVIRASFAGLPISAPLEQHERWAEIADLESPRARLRAFVAFTCEVLGRTSPIHAVIRGAADGEPAAARLRDELLQGRTSFIVGRVDAYLAGALRPGLTVREAGERYATLFSPELYTLVTVGLGWSPEQHRRWLGRLAEDDLLGPG